MMKCEASGFSISLLQEIRIQLLKNGEGESAEFLSTKIKAINE